MFASVENCLPARIVFEKLVREERVRTVRSAIIDRALPGVESSIGANGMSRTDFCTFAALVAEIAFKGIIRFERGIRHNEHEPDEGSEFRYNDIAFAGDRSEAADTGGFRKVHDDVRSGFARSDGFRMNQFIGVDQFGICRMVAFDLEVRDVALKTGVVSFVFDQRAHFQQEDFRELLVNEFDSELRIIEKLRAVLHGPVEGAGNAEAEADDAGRRGKNLFRIALGDRARIMGDVADADEIRTVFFCFLFDQLSCQHVDFSYRSMTQALPVRRRVLKRCSMHPPFFSSMETQARMHPPHFAIL